MTKPEDRYALRLELHRAAAVLLDADPQLASVVLDVIQNWEQRLPTSDPRISEWQRLMQERRWRELLAETNSAAELRRGSPVVFVLPADERMRIKRSYPISATRSSDPFSQSASGIDAPQ